MVVAAVNKGDKGLTQVRLLHDYCRFDCSDVTRLALQACGNA
jgi:hypothetical protein